jgi:hypothetical protein
MHARLTRLAFAGALVLGTALPTAASAAIHPITSSECAARESQTGAGDLQDPPGQTPSGPTLDQSDLRALQATGVLTFVDGVPVFDPTNPALNGNSGAEHCPNAAP